MTTQDPIRQSIDKSDPEAEEIEIRLSDIVHFLRDSRWIMLRGIIAFAIIGVLYALSKPNEYTSTVRVMPELNAPAGTGGGSLKSLAGLAGISIDNLGGTSDAIRPDLYPDIIQSIPFTLYLLDKLVTTRENSNPRSLLHYFNELGSGGLFGGSGKAEEKSEKLSKPIGGTLQLTRQQDELNTIISQRVSASIDKKSGIITITSQMPDPVVAATVARQTLDYLTNYITNYRTGKSRKQVQFLTQQVNNARRRYQAAELAVSSYRDRNRSLFLETAKIEEQRLQADYLLAQTVYNDLSKQLEQARITVQEESPVFQVLEPARIPLKKSGPKRTLIVAGFAIMGLVLSLVYALFRKWRRTM